MMQVAKSTKDFELFGSATLTVPRLRAKNLKILRALAYLRHSHLP
jgi:hypothetical protein